MSYSIEIVSGAEKEYLSLPEPAKGQIRSKILSLEHNPRPFGVKKLRDSDYYRIRIRDYRVIYAIDDKRKTVKVLSIAHRKEVYR